MIGKLVRVKYKSRIERGSPDIGIVLSKYSAGLHPKAYIVLLGGIKHRLYSYEFEVIQ